MHILQEDNMLRRLADEHNVLIVVPNGTHVRTGAFDGDRQRWNSGLLVDLPMVETVDDVRFLNDLVEHVTSQLNIDSKRIFISGISDGGFMIQRLLRETPQSFTAAATLLATMVDSPEMLDSQPTHTVPLLLWMNTEDPNFIGQPDGLAGAIVSAEETFAWWVKQNGAQINAPEQISQPDNRGCYTTRSRSYGRSPTYFYTTIGGGHIISSISFHAGNPRRLLNTVGYQCQDIETFSQVWDFFSKVE